MIGGVVVGSELLVEAGLPPVDEVDGNVAMVMVALLEVVVCWPKPEEA